MAEIDLQIASLNQKASTLPESVTHRELLIQFETSRDLRIAAETELSDMSSEINRAENDVEQVVKRIERDEARLSAGQVSPKELEQLQHEIGSLNARRAELEEVELEVMLRVDDIKSRISNLKSQEAELANQVSEAAVKRDSALAEIDNLLKEAVAERGELIPIIDKALTELYEKVRSGGGIGAARLANGKCNGCNLAINTVELNKLLALADEEVARCEECRCILVRR